MPRPASSVTSSALLTRRAGSRLPVPAMRVNLGSGNVGGGSVGGGRAGLRFMRLWRGARQRG